MPTIMAPQPAFEASLFPVYGIGVFLAVASFVIMLLIIPPFCWHWRNGNIGATFFIGWTAILLLFSFINEMIWPSDDIASWWNGVGLCDVEVKIQVASQVGFPAAFCCVLKALAWILDTERVVMETEAQKRRARWIDLFICVFPASFEMVLAYVVQPARYFIFGMSGCTVSTVSSWLQIVLINGISGLWILVDAFFAALILIRLYRYRLHFASILASTNTSKSRFLRLYLICVVWILASTAIWCYDLWWNLIRGQSTSAFTWSEAHDQATWNTIYEEPSMGVVLYDRWIWIVAGVMIFIFFGLGKEATRMYRSLLVEMGFARFFPSLVLDNSDYGSHGSQSRKTLSQICSKICTRSGSPSGSAQSSSIDQITAASTAKSQARIGVTASEDDVLPLHSMPAMKHTDKITGQEPQTHQNEAKNHGDDAKDAMQWFKPIRQDVVDGDKSIFVRKKVMVEEEPAESIHPST